MNSYRVDKNLIPLCLIDNYVNEINEINNFINGNSASQLTLGGLVYDLGNTLLHKYEIAKTVENSVKNYLESNRIYAAGWQLRMDRPDNSSELLGYHRDMDYFPKLALEGRGAVSWIPLTDVNQKTGTIEVSSHVYPYDFFECREVVREFPNRKPHRVFEINYTPTGDEEVISAQAGDHVAFLMTTPHRSLPNMSGQTRLTLQIRWFPYDDKFAPDRASIE